MKIYLEQTDSTNRIAKEKAASGVPNRTVIWAGHQDAGRGQHGRSFASPAGGLYFSLILRPDFAPEHLPLITLITGLACRDVLFETWGVEAKIKWPNDLYIGKKKVGGILCENSFDTTVSPPQSTVIIGVGVNLNSRLNDFPLELRSLVTTVAEQTQCEMDSEAALDQFVEKIDQYVKGLPANRDSLLDRWQNYDYLMQRPVKYINGDRVVSGTGLGIGLDGRYCIRDEKGLTHSIIGGQLRPRE